MYENGWYSANSPAWAIFELTKKRTMNTLVMMSGQFRNTHRLMEFKVTLKVDGQWINLTGLKVQEDKEGVKEGVQISYMGKTVNVVLADVIASNGVIHTIDEVILSEETPTTTTQKPTTTTAELGDVVDVAIAAGNFKTLVQLLTDLDLVDDLRKAAAQTIFAPSDEAFAKLPEGILKNLTKEEKRAIVLRHVVGEDTLLETDLTTGTVETLGGESIDLIKTDPIAQIGGDGTVTLASGIRVLQLEFNTVFNVQSIRLDVTKTDASDNNVVVNEIIPKFEHSVGKL